MEVMDNSTTILAVICALVLLQGKVFTQDQVVHTGLSSTARLPCGSTSRPFPSDARRVFWYKGNDVTDTRTIILYYKFSDSFTRHFNDFSSHKHSCSSDRVLSITDVGPGDQATYTCNAFGSVISFSFTVELVLSDFVRQYSRAMLPCFTVPNDTLRIQWYKGSHTDISRTILSYDVNTGSVIYLNGHSADKHSCNAEGVLSISDVQISDEMEYSCEVVPNVKISSIMLSVLVPPSTPTLLLPTIEENTSTSIQCVIDSVKPGLGSVLFTVTVGSDIIVESVDSKISEESSEPGTVSVTYSDMLSLQRKHNRQQAVCTVVWRDGEETVTSESVTVDMLFSSTSITMTHSPNGLVSEYTEITFTCLTDESNPTASVTWTVDGEIRSSTTDSTLDDGVYNALRRQSVLTLTADRGLHNSIVKCVVSENKQLVAQETLNISFPPDVTIKHYPTSPIIEGNGVILTCDAQGGNPSTVLSYKWIFTPRINITLAISRDINRQIVFIAEDINAGEYNCIANNSVGVQMGKKDIFIHYSVKDESTFYQKILYTDVGENPLLNCTLTSYPVLSIDDIKVVHLPSNHKIEHFEIISANNRVDETIIQLTFDRVTLDDFGIYQVTASNGVGEELKIEMDLRKRGIPEPPTFLTVESVTAISITLSWIPGRSGGANQTFTLYYRKGDETNINFYSDIIDPQTNSKVTFTLKDIQPMMSYYVSVRAINKYGRSLDENDIPIKTLDVPKLKGSLTAELHPDLMIFFWPNITGIYSELFIFSCLNLHDNCESLFTTHNSPSHFVVRNPDERTNYFLSIYQGNEEVFRGQFLPKDMAQGDKGLLAGLISFALVTCILVFGLTAYFCCRKARNGLKEVKKSAGDTVYYNTATKVVETFDYEQTQPEETKPTAEYTDLQGTAYEELSSAKSDNDKSLNMT